MMDRLALHDKGSDDRVEVHEVFLAVRNAFTLFGKPCAITVISGLCMINMLFESASGPSAAAVAHVRRL
jgi:hypothetical protein